MNLFWEILLIIIGVVLYFGIGGILRLYYCNNVLYKKELTVLAEIAAGGWDLFANWEFEKFIIPVVWPAFILLVLATWLIFFIYLLLWFIFTGGIVKLICPKLTDAKPSS